jgi:hypothetical protein
LFCLVLSCSETQTEEDNGKIKITFIKKNLKCCVNIRSQVSRPVRIGLMIGDQVIIGMCQRDRQATAFISYKAKQWFFCR